MWTRFITVIIWFLSPCASFKCGGVTIDDHKECFCGNTTITRGHVGEYSPQPEYCCGKDTCTIQEDGTALCPNGLSCSPWFVDSLCGSGCDFSSKCGDVWRVDGDGCRCGSEDPPYIYNPGWCCPSSQCSFWNIHFQPQYL